MRSVILNAPKADTGPEVWTRLRLIAEMTILARAAECLGGTHPQPPPFQGGEEAAERLGGASAVSVAAAAEFALGAGAVGAAFGLRFAIGFGAIRGTSRVTPLLVAMLAAAVLRR